ncbi:hypothetical protein Daesc_008395 [Daldinia eschscholtzii]|uniref:Uncharacterized protein n=1 Tax=Daldinia eschscholtzii TaxID=292717 RepID=A0AAX6MCZ9_9PEZI
MHATPTPTASPAIAPPLNPPPPPPEFEVCCSASAGAVAAAGEVMLVAEAVGDEGQPHDAVQTALARLGTDIFHLTVVMTDSQRQNINILVSCSVEFPEHAPWAQGTEPGPIYRILLHRHWASSGPVQCEFWLIEDSIHGWAHSGSIKGAGAVIWDSTGPRAKWTATDPVYTNRRRKGGGRIPTAATALCRLSAVDVNSILSFPRPSREAV